MFEDRFRLDHPLLLLREGVPCDVDAVGSRCDAAGRGATGADRSVMRPRSESTKWISSCVRAVFELISGVVLSLSEGAREEKGLNEPSMVTVASGARALRCWKMMSVQ